MKSLAIAKASPAKSNLDIAVKGNQLVDYMVGSSGANGPICFTVKPPAVAKGFPGQAQWVMYFEPQISTKTSIVLIKNGLTTCAQAKIFANLLKDSERVKVSTDSLSLAKEAVMQIPSNVLTQSGLKLLDEARGLVGNSPTPTSTK